MPLKLIHEFRSFRGATISIFGTPMRTRRRPSLVSTTFRLDVMFTNEFKAIRRMGFRQVFNHIIAFVSLMRARGQALLQALNFCNVIASGLMMWKGLGLLTNTESPIVVVLRYLVPTHRLPRRCIC